MAYTGPIYKQTVDYNNVRVLEHMNTFCILFIGPVWMAKVSRAEIHWRVLSGIWSWICQRAAVWSEGEIYYPGNIMRVLLKLLKILECFFFLPLSKTLVVLSLPSGVQAGVIPEKAWDWEFEPSFCGSSLSGLCAAWVWITTERFSSAMGQPGVRDCQPTSTIYTYLPLSLLHLQ